MDIRKQAVCDAFLILKTQHNSCTYLASGAFYKQKFLLALN